jgi:hypothetical protein
VATSWRYRILRRDGTEITTDLPHTVDSHSQVFGIVRGLWPPKSQIGRLTVPLIPPKGQTQPQAEWAGVNVEALYAQLKYGQRIERYTRATVWSASKAYNRNDVVVVSAVEYVCISPHTNHTPPNATYWALANPTFTGLIEKLPRDLKTFSFEAQDSFGLHQKAEAERKDYFYDTSTNIIKYAITDWTLLYGDDFATQDMTMTDGTLRQYGQQQSPPSSVRWAPAIIDRKSWASITGMEAGRRYVLHNQATYSAAQLVPSKIDAVIRVNVPANGGVTAGLILGLDPATGACWQVEFGANTTPLADGTGGPNNEANGTLKLYNYPSWAGAPTQYFPPGPDGGVLAGAAGLTGPAGMCLADGTIQLDYQLTILPKDAASGGAAGIRVLINGQDITGSTVLVPGLSMTNAIGLYAYSSFGGGTVSVRNWYAFKRGPSMALTAGFPVTTDLIELQFNQASGLDMLMIAANAGDIDIRKEPRRDQDLIDGAVGGFAAIAGGPPVFTEQFKAAVPGNLITGQEQDNASLFATQLKVQATGMGGVPTVYVARDLQSIRDYGLWTRQENLEDVTNFKVLIAAGDAAAELSSDPATSRTIIVEDGPSTVGLWRELSTIRLLAPHLDPALADTLRQVVGYEETEGSPQKTLHLDNYPASMALADVQKLKSSIDNLIGQALTYRAPPPMNPGPADGPPGWSPPNWPPVLPSSGGSIRWGAPLTFRPAPATGAGAGTGGITLIGGGPIPNGITLPVTYVNGDRINTGSIPFHITGHTCNVLAFATIALQLASSDAFVKVQLHVGPNVSTAINESQPTRIGANQTLETGTALIAPPWTTLAVGDYVAWVTVEPLASGTLTDAIGEIQIYCV